LLAVVLKLNGEEGMVAVSEGTVLNEGAQLFGCGGMRGMTGGFMT